MSYIDGYFDRSSDIIRVVERQNKERVFKERSNSLLLEQETVCSQAAAKALVSSGGFEDPLGCIRPPASGRGSFRSLKPKPFQATRQF